MKDAVVIGAGIAGMQAALDLADQGIKVHLIEKYPSIGGRMSQLDKTFPTLDCSSCILTPKMVDCSRHENISLYTYSEVDNISGEKGNFTITIKQKPRYVNSDTCTGCGICVQKCPYKAPNNFDENMGKRKVIYFEFPQAIPLVPVIDAPNCQYFKNGKCKACQKNCPVEGCIDFEQKETMIEINAGTIIYATGFDLYDPKNDYGYNEYEDVVTSLEFERLMSSTGPNNGHLKRPSNGKDPKKIGIILCVGSRSQLENENWYCSRFCCMAAIKQAIIIKDHYPETDVSIYYMDIRAFGKGFQEFYNRAIEEYGINFIKGRVGKVTNSAGTDGSLLTLRYEDIKNSRIMEEERDLVILAVGIEPREEQLISDLKILDDGFIAPEDVYLDSVNTSIPGILVCGTAEGPKDIPDSVVQASAAAIRAANILRGKN